MATFIQIGLRHINLDNIVGVEESLPGTKPGARIYTTDGKSEYLFGLEAVKLIQFLKSIEEYKYVPEYAPRQEA